MFNCCLFKIKFGMYIPIQLYAHVMVKVQQQGYRSVSSLPFQESTTDRPIIEPTGHEDSQRSYTSNKDPMKEFSKVKFYQKLSVVCGAERDTFHFNFIRSISITTLFPHFVRLIRLFRSATTAEWCHICGGRSGKGSFIKLLLI